jgi:hypothetical protein
MELSSNCNKAFTLPTYVAAAPGGATPKKEHE